MGKIKRNLIIAIGTIIFIYGVLQILIQGRASFGEVVLIIIALLIGGYILCDKWKSNRIIGATGKIIKGVLFFLLVIMIVGEGLIINGQLKSSGDKNNRLLVIGYSGNEDETDILKRIEIGNKISKNYAEYLFISDKSEKEELPEESIEKIHRTLQGNNLRVYSTEDIFHSLKMNYAYSGSNKVDVVTSSYNAFRIKSIMEQFGMEYRLIKSQNGGVEIVSKHINEIKEIYRTIIMDLIPYMKIKL